MNDESLRAEVWRTVQTLNRAWTTEGDPLKLRDYFHRDMVAITPTDRFRREGRDACVAGWQSFADSVTVHSWEERDEKIQLYADGQTAVVTYNYTLSCRLGSQTLTMTGRDMMFLVREDDRWQVVADQFSPFPAS